MQRVINETISEFFSSRLRVLFELNKQPKGVLSNCAWVTDIIKKREKPSSWNSAVNKPVSPFCPQVWFSTAVDGRHDRQMQRRCCAAEIKVAVIKTASATIITCRVCATALMKQQGSTEQPPSKQGTFFCFCFFAFLLECHPMLSMLSWCDTPRAHTQTHTLTRGFTSCKCKSVWLF